MFCNKRCSQKLRKILRKTPVSEFSSEFCEISKDTFFIEYLRANASANSYGGNKYISSKGFRKVSIRSIRKLNIILDCRANIYRKFAKLISNSNSFRWFRKGERMVVKNLSFPGRCFAIIVSYLIRLIWHHYIWYHVTKNLL